MGKASTMKKRGNAKDGGKQKDLLSFFGKKSSKESEADKENAPIKENTPIMGLDSNLRKSAIAKAKEHGKTRKNTQKTMDGGFAEGRCDEGTKECPACKYKVEKGKASKHIVHDITCKCNSNYKLTSGGRISMSEYYLQMYEKEREKGLRNFSVENCKESLKQEDFDVFFCPSTQDEGKRIQKTCATSEILSEYETDKMILRINDRMKAPSGAMRRGKTVPLVVSAAIQSLLDLLPIHFKKNTNEVMASNPKTITYKKLQAYRKKFPCGTIGFTFQRANKQQAPDRYYSQLEGRTIYFVCWELNAPGWEPTCYECGHKMIHDEYDFQSHGYATPIYQVTGITDYAVSMYYNCSNQECKCRCKANDGRILMTVPLEIRNGYPVDPRYATDNKERHLAKSFSRVMDKLFITHGNGEQLAIMLHELRGDQYLDTEEEYYCQAIQTGHKVAKSLPAFEYAIGRYSPSGAELRDWKDAAACSNHTSTGVSDKDRACRELQGVGCKKNSSSDHTFAIKANYQDVTSDTACAHSIGNERGEMASICIVPDTKQISYAHQAEHCVGRDNWNPKCHTTDTCPSGNAFWKNRIRGVHCQLGMFHFLYRITKTLNKECSLWKESVAALQTCLYYFEESDLRAVERCLREGLLGKVNGIPCIEEDVEAKARTYRENIRIWTYKENDIIDNLLQWIRDYENVYDEKHEHLFTSATEKTALEQTKKAKWVVDQLSKDELYLEVTPTLRSSTGLSFFIGARGAESKLEKAHHAIAHFANTGMRHTLADFLGIAGLALYNLRIRYRHKLAELPAAKRAEVPVAFQNSPAFTNHLRLSQNNKLALQAGLDSNVHKNVEILQPDNGERFLYEYYLQEIQRKNDGIQNDPKTNRCLCKDCGLNPYHRKRKGCWRTQNDLPELAPPGHAEEQVRQPPQETPTAPPSVPAPLSIVEIAPSTTSVSEITSSTENVQRMLYQMVLNQQLQQQQLYLTLQQQQRQQVRVPVQRYAYTSIVSSKKEKKD